MPKFGSDPELVEQSIRIHTRAKQQWLDDFQVVGDVRKRRKRDLCFFVQQPAGLSLPDPRPLTERCLGPFIPIEKCSEIVANDRQRTGRRFSDGFRHICSVARRLSHL